MLWADYSNAKWLLWFGCASAFFNCVAVLNISKDLRDFVVYFLWLPTSVGAVILFVYDVSMYHVGLDHGVLCIDLGLVFGLGFIVLGCGCYYENREGYSSW